MMLNIDVELVIVVRCIVIAFLSIGIDKIFS